MTFDKLIIPRGHIALRKNLKSHFGVLHLLCKSIHPTCIAIRLVKCLSFLNALWQGYAKLLVPLQVLSVWGQLNVYAWVKD